jgi:hypothetical protein
MQRLNLMTLGALAIGFCGFIYDASTDYRRDVAERPSYVAQRAEASGAGPVVLAAYGPANAFGYSLIVN